MNKLKINKFTVVFSLFIISALTFFCLCLFKEHESYGHLQIYVMDAYDLTPLKGATVVLPEFGMQNCSDENGNVVFENVPCKKNEALERLIPVNFGQTTILCYCSGYEPYALFYAEIRENRMREGLTLYLFPNSENSGCMIEAPPEEWVNELLRRYEPEKP